MIFLAGAEVSACKTIAVPAHAFARKMSSGLGGLNKSPNGVVLGMVQLKLPDVKTKADLTKYVCSLLAKIFLP